MKTEEPISTVLGDGAGVSPLGSHEFLDEFALAYHRAVAKRLRSSSHFVGVLSTKERLKILAACKQRATV